jgi:hypothetical protein
MAQRPGGRAAEGDGRARGERHDGQGLALLREDAGFHAYQMLEAGIRQFTAWGDTDEGRRILVAVARYLAAHSPTERAALQTADIARRLMRGGELHHEAAVS